MLLERYRLEKGKTASELYKGACIDKRHYSKIMGNRDWRPQKNTVLSLGLSLNLTAAEMRALLESAGFALSRSIVADLVITFCVNSGIYDLHEVNALLSVAGEKPLARE